MKTSAPPIEVIFLGVLYVLLLSVVSAHERTIRRITAADLLAVRNFEEAKSRPTRSGHPRGSSNSTLYKVPTTLDNSVVLPTDVSRAESPAKPRDGTRRRAFTTRPPDVVTYHPRWNVNVSSTAGATTDGSAPQRGVKTLQESGYRTNEVEYTGNRYAANVVDQLENNIQQGVSSRYGNRVEAAHLGPTTEFQVGQFQPNVQSAGSRIRGVTAAQIKKQGRNSTSSSAVQPEQKNETQTSEESNHIPPFPYDEHLQRFDDDFDRISSVISRDIQASRSKAMEEMWKTHSMVRERVTSTDRLPSESYIDEHEMDVPNVYVEPSFAAAEIGTMASPGFKSTTRSEDTYRWMADWTPSDWPRFTTPVFATMPSHPSLSVNYKDFKTMLYANKSDPTSSKMDMYMAAGTVVDLSTSYISVERITPNSTVDSSSSTDIVKIVPTPVLQTARYSIEKRDDHEKNEVKVNVELVPSQSQDIAMTSLRTVVVSPTASMPDQNSMAVEAMSITAAFRRPAWVPVPSSATETEEGRVHAKTTPWIARRTSNRSRSTTPAPTKRISTTQGTFTTDGFKPIRRQTVRYGQRYGQPTDPKRNYTTWDAWEATRYTRRPPMSTTVTNKSRRPVNRLKFPSTTMIPTTEATTNEPQHRQGPKDDQYMTTPAPPPTTGTPVPRRKETTTEENFTPQIARLENAIPLQPSFIHEVTRTKTSTQKPTLRTSTNEPREENDTTKVSPNSAMQENKVYTVQVLPDQTWLPSPTVSIASASVQPPTTAVLTEPSVSTTSINEEPSTTTEEISTRPQDVSSEAPITEAAVSDPDNALDGVTTESEERESVSTTGATSLATTTTTTTSTIPVTTRQSVPTTSNSLTTTAETTSAESSTVSSLSSTTPAAPTTTNPPTTTIREVTEKAMVDGDSSTKSKLEPTVESITTEASMNTTTRHFVTFKTTPQWLPSTELGTSPPIRTTEATVETTEGKGDDPLLSPTFKAYLQLMLESSWKDVCENLAGFRVAMAQILERMTHGVVLPRRIVLLNMESACTERPENNEGLIPVSFYVEDEYGNFDRQLTETFALHWSQVEPIDIVYQKEIKQVNLVYLNDPEMQATTENGGIIAAITISCIAAACLLLLGVLLVVMKKRQKGFTYGRRCTPVSLDAYSLDSVSVYNSVRRKGVRASKRSYGNPAFDDPNAPSHPMNFAGLANFSSDRDALDEEFKMIPQCMPKMDELPDGAETKNRYANVIPLPETRVHLSQMDGDPLSEYINANYIKGPKHEPKFYIACQAPMKSTITDFWRMVWEQQSKVVFMLTDLVENGVEKCADYLPPSEVLDCHRLFGDFQVTLKKREVREKYIISSLQLKNMEANLWREVTHFWYLKWPAQGVPDECSSVIAFLIEARPYVKNNPGPTIVHCSPGTGRTGTVLACDICIREFEHTRMVDIPRCVYRLRRDRAGAVQTRDQYYFIYQVLNLYAAKLTGGVMDSL